MSIEWTADQLRAINARGHNVLVSAAAGSGKTTVLVDRVIRLITDTQNPVRIDRLLIVTFTNAAANGMSVKIHDALHRLLDEGGNEHLAAQL